MFSCTYDVKVKKEPAAGNMLPAFMMPSEIVEYLIQSRLDFVVRLFADRLSGRVRVWCNRWQERQFHRFAKRRETLAARQDVECAVDDDRHDGNLRVDSQLRERQMEFAH